MNEVGQGARWCEAAILPGGGVRTEGETRKTERKKRKRRSALQPKKVKEKSPKHQQINTRSVIHSPLSSVFLSITL